MKKINKLILIVLIFASVLLYDSSISFANRISRPIYLSVNLMKDANGSYDSFNVSWKNDESIQKLLSGQQEVRYEVDIKIDNQPWLSEYDSPLLNGTLDSKNLTSQSIALTKDSVSMLKEADIFQNSISFRVRYLINGQQGPFSNLVRVGVRPSYQNVSEWSESELRSANQNGFISSIIQSNMKKELSREEFSDIIMRVYEKIKRVHIVIGNTPFSDSKNPSVIKAARLGIVKGTGNGKFSPQNAITREEMATILTRFLITMDEPVNDTIKRDLFQDHNQISPWALDSVYQLQGYSLIEGDQNRNFMPKKRATREQGVVLGQRIYELINK